MTLIMIDMSMIFDPWPWCIYAWIHDANLYDPWSWCMCVWCRYEWCLYPWSRTLMHVPLMRDFFVSHQRTNEPTNKAILGVGLVKVKCMPAPFYNLLCAPPHILTVHFWLHAEILISPNNCCVAPLHWDGLWKKDTMCPLRVGRSKPFHFSHVFNYGLSFSS